MLRLIFVVALAHGAAIPTQPATPSCLEQCVSQGGVVGAASDLMFFKSVAVDVNNFCNVYTTLLTCAATCSQDDLNLLMNHTQHAAYICKNKLEEVKAVHDCLENDPVDPLSECAKQCEVKDQMMLRLDSSASAPVNPNVPADGTAPICTKQMCVLKCARGSLNKQCSGAGDLFRDAARHQVELGWAQLQEQSENMNDTASQLVALSYLANIPENCVYLTNTEEFDHLLATEEEKAKGMFPGAPMADFSNDTSVEFTELEFFEPEGSPAATILPGDSTSDAPVPVPAEEDVKIVGQIKPSESTDASAKMPESATSEDSAEDFEEGMHQQPAPAEKPETVSEENDEDDMATSTVSAVISGEGTGLVPSRPITEEDKDKVVSAEEDFTEEKETSPTDEKKEDEVLSPDVQNTDSTMESVEENKESTPETLSVDNEKEIEDNTVVASTEAVKVNSSPLIGLLSTSAFVLSALLLV